MELLKRQEKAAPVKVLMFGEGNFLRAFAAFIVEKMNENGFDGSITAVQGVEKGLCDMINAQDGLYTVIERGIENGKVLERETLINSLANCINPYENYSSLLNIAKNPELKAIISNTTEFGICYEQSETNNLNEHKNYPAKLTDFLFTRFKNFGGAKDKGLVILPCELIDRNGDKLKDIVLRYASEWNLDKKFIEWLNHACIFTNTLVDRIVSGYPKVEAEKICQKLGYKDNLLDVCEPFLLWVIEGDKKLLETLPLDKCGLNIIVTDNLESYRTRKVRILNGAHTMSVLAGHLAGLDFVEQLVCDDVFSKYLKRGIFEEIIPVMQGENLSEYAENVLERFKNPFLNHRLLSISLNSISKFKTRVLPSIKDYAKKFNKAPEILSFALAALIRFYKTGIDKFVNDEQKYLLQMKECSFDITKILKNIDFWGEDLTEIFGFEKRVKFYINKLENYPIKNVVLELVK